jgi:peroxiredoxin
MSILYVLKENNRRCIKSHPLKTFNSPYLQFSSLSLRFYLPSMQNSKTIVERLGSLSDELEIRKSEFIDVAPQDFQEIMFDRMKAMAESEILDLAVKKGEIAPDFCLPDSNGNMVSSVDLRAKGPLVVIFFRGNWCPYCDATLRMVRKYTPHFKARGATVVAISPQTVEESAKIVKDAGLNFPVLSDINSEYAQLCNIAYVLDDVLRPIFEQLGVNIAETNADDSYILPIPATYVIQTDGRVAYSFLETDFTKRAEPVDVLNALPRLQVSRHRLLLSENIAFELAKLQDTYPDGKMRSMFEEVERLKASGIEASSLQVGKKALDFKLNGRDGQLVDSRKLRKQGPLIVTFFQGQKSPLDMVTLESMQAQYSRFLAKGASFVAIGPGSTTSDDLYKTVAFSGAKFPLLSDTADNQVAQQFGIAHELEGNLFGEGTIPMASTYVIDRSGIILYSFVDVDPTKRAEPSTVLKAVPTKSQPRSPLTRGPFSFFFGRRLSPRTSQAI